MAANQTVSKLIRQVQEGLDKYIDHADKFYKGRYREVAKIEKHDKLFYEWMQQVNPGLASERGEGAEYTNFGTLDQEFVTQRRLLTYEIAFKITLEAMKFNLYQGVPEKMIKDGFNSHEGRRDWDVANLLNNGFDSNFAGPDGKELFASDHPIYDSSDTVSNIITQDFDQDALEQMKIKVDKFVMSNGLQADYNCVALVYPEDIQYEVKRVLGSEYEPATANNAINPMKDVVKPIKWKRLSDKDSFFLITDAPDGLCVKEAMPIEVSQTNDQNSPDAIIALIQIYKAMWLDWRLGVGSQGV